MTEINLYNTKSDANFSECEYENAYFLWEQSSKKFVIVPRKIKLKDVYKLVKDKLIKEKIGFSGAICLHECIMARCNQKIKFDIDIDVKILTETSFTDGMMGEIGNEFKFKCVINIIKKYIRLTWDELFPSDPLTTILIYTCNRAKKYSAHIIIPKYVVKDVFHCRYFHKMLIKKISNYREEIISFIDNVNKMFQQFRLPSSKKEGRYFEHSKIHSDNFNEEKYELYGIDSLITDTSNCKLLPEIDDACEAAQESIKYDIGEKIEDINQILDRLDNSTKTELSSNFVFRKVQGNIIYYDRIKPSYCSICKRIHENESVYLLVNSGQIKFKCMRNWKKSIISGSIQTKKCNNYFYEDYLKIIKNVCSIEEIREYILSSLAYVSMNSGFVWVMKKRQMNIQIYRKDNKPDITIMQDVNYVLQYTHPFDVENGPKVTIVKNSVETVVTMYSLVEKYKSLITYYSLQFLPYSSYDDTIKKKCEKHRIFNIFTGFKWSKWTESKVTEHEIKKIQPMLDHLLVVLCNNDKKVYDYVIKWITHLLVYPYEKIGVALLFYSDQGVGKNIFWQDFIANYVIGGKYSIVIDDIERLFARFNKYQSYKLLNILDEIGNYGGAYKNNNKLKSTITRKDVMIEPKGKELYSILCFARYVLLTNNPWGICVESSDRRNLPIECNNDKIGDKKYFKKLAECLTYECGEIFFNYCLHRVDISNWEFRDIPFTNYKMELIRNSMDPVLTYMAGFLNGDDICNDLLAGMTVCKINEAKDSYMMKEKRFYEYFTGWQITQMKVRGRQLLSQTFMKKELINKFGFTSVKRSRTNYFIICIPDIIKGMKRRLKIDLFEKLIISIGNISCAAVEIIKIHFSDDYGPVEDESTLVESDDIDDLTNELYNVSEI